MEEDTDLMSTRDAAAYLKMPYATFKYHVEHGHVPTRLVGGRRVFTKAQLDIFANTPRPSSGRPPKPKE